MNIRQLLTGVPFSPLHPLIPLLPVSGFPSLAELNAMQGVQDILVGQAARLKFVEQECGPLAFEAQYEPRCYLNGEVQTRQDNWHDFFNALVWLTFPKSKAVINTLHYRELTDDNAKHGRGAVRDTATLLDESGVIVACADAELAQMLRDFRWKELFWQNRERVERSIGFYLFGHGLYEKALHPYVGMTAQGWVLEVDQTFFDDTHSGQLAHLDSKLAGQIEDPARCRNTRELSPVPLLGIPGWSRDNESEAYYDNSSYFRPGRLVAV